MVYMSDNGDVAEFHNDVPENPKNQSAIIGKRRVIDSDRKQIVTPFYRIFKR